MVPPGSPPLWRENPRGKSPKGIQKPGGKKGGFPRVLKGKVTPGAQPGPCVKRAQGKKLEKKKGMERPPEIKRDLKKRVKKWCENKCQTQN